MSDNKELVELRFTDEELLKYMIMAHEMDVTFNEFVEMALKHAIAEHLSKENNDQPNS